MTPINPPRFIRHGNLLRLLGACSLVLALTACGGDNAGSGNGQVITAATVLSVSTLLFEDKALSASGQQACVSCHTNETAHADAAGTHLPLGGAAMNKQGFRSSPSLLYLEKNGAFRFAENGEPFGGFTWDGRANSRAEQAGAPLLDASEMDNRSIAEVAARVRSLPYLQDFLSVFGLGANSGDQAVFDTLRLALERYQKLDSDYLLFNSRYDRWMDGTGSLTAPELRGLAIFEDPARGNCASCHPNRAANDRARPVFTTFGYAALGLPRNPMIQANADPGFYDMGLCGPKRTDLATRTDLCGKFKIPTLRNIELTAPYFHNGVVGTLEEAVAFYATRDIDPRRWYPLVGGIVDRFNDLPPNLHSNVHQGAPFGLLPGDPPRLTPDDVSDLIAFLRTLTDDRTAPQAQALMNPSP